MKIHITDGKITATPETKADVELLLKYVNPNSFAPTKEDKRKKTHWKRECEICHKICKGKHGLRLHMHLKHKLPQEQNNLI